MSGNLPTDGATDSAVAPAGPPAAAPAADRAGREPGELIVALSPRQIVGGFAVVAGLIVWLLRRARRKG
jgi:hypothetical protein